MKPQNHIPVRAEFYLLLAGAFLLAFYVLLRYGGLWGEADTHVFTSVIRSMLDAEELLQVGNVYPNGYGYQTLGVLLIHATGIELSALQLYGSVLLMVWIVFPAWLLYRDLTGSSRAGILATVLLLIQPEFLFPILRGTHEKFTRGLMLLAVYLIIRSLYARWNVNRFASWLIAFYICAYALITFNNLLASSFIVAICVSLALIWTVKRLNRLNARSAKVLAIQRLTYAAIISLSLAFIFTFYAYKPARHNLSVFQTIGERTAALALDVEAKSANPYAAVNTGWISLRVYLMLSLANWLLLSMSALIWMWESLTWLRHREWLPGTKGHDESGLLLWAFYGAFAFVGAVSVISDLSGALGSNLQHRLFPSFAMFGAPVVAKWLANVSHNKHYTQLFLWGSIGILAIFSTLKATNEPLFSNKWLFHTHAEMQALDWANIYLTEQRLWVEHDERLSSALSIRTGDEHLDVSLDQAIVDRGTRDFLISNIIRRRSVRMSAPLPIHADSLRTYDNGEAQIYHWRPRTPYQR